jgi:excisionase family DNA binding protein
MQANKNTPNDDGDLDLLSSEQAARRLGIKPRNFWLRVHGGEIPFIKIGALYKFLPKDLDEYIEARRVR